MAFSREELKRAAQRMLADYDARRPNEIFAERGSSWLSLDDAYAVQRAVAELRRARGEHCLGYKIGCVSPSIQSQLGLSQPVHGYVWDTEAHSTGCHLEATRFANLAIEGEIALRLRRDILPDWTASEDALSDCVECWFPVIELHNYLFRGEKLTSQELVAGNAMHVGFIAPADSENQSMETLNDADIQVEIDDVLVESTKVATLPGGPLGSLRWLASSLGPKGESLKAGCIVLTGSPGRLIEINRGGSVTVTSGKQQVYFSCA